MERKCWFCSSQVWPEEHHIFQGAYRKKSEHYGFVVTLCHYCHNEPPLGVHHNHERNLMLKQWAQRTFEATHTRDEFMAIFGKSYLELDGLRREES